MNFCTVTRGRTKERLKKKKCFLLFFVVFFQIRWTWWKHSKMYRTQLTFCSHIIDCFLHVWTYWVIQVIFHQFKFNTRESKPNRRQGKWPWKLLGQVQRVCSISKTIEVELHWRNSWKIHPQETHSCKQMWVQINYSFLQENQED